METLHDLQSEAPNWLNFRCAHVEAFKFDLWDGRVNLTVAEGWPDADNPPRSVNVTYMGVLDLRWRHDSSALHLDEFDVFDDRPISTEDLPAPTFSVEPGTWPLSDRPVRRLRALIFDSTYVEFVYEQSQVADGDAIDAA